MYVPRLRSDMSISFGGGGGGFPYKSGKQQKPVKPERWSLYGVVGTHPVVWN